MGIVSAIENRLESNAEQRHKIQSIGNGRSREQEIHLEYLKIEAKTFDDMISELQTKRWALFSNKRFLFVLAVFAMSLYVMGIFYMFQDLDLSKVEQWQFAMTALPFWLILSLIPMALIAFLTARSSRN